MLAAMRRKKIYEEIRERKSVPVPFLAKQFSVTEETIRRDLKVLEAEGMVIRTYGGAFIQDGVENLVDANIRSGAYVENKRIIAERSRQFVHEGDTIFLDNSTTAFHLANELKDMDLTVLTNNLPIINLLSHSDSIRLVVIGGIYSSTENAFCGDMTVRELDNYFVDSSFLSCRSISLENGITDSVEKWTRLRQEAIRRSNKSYIIADHTKFGRTSYLWICDFSSISALITDVALSPEWHEELGRQGCAIIEEDNTGNVQKVEDLPMKKTRKVATE